MTAALLSAWRWLRAVTGDSAYDAYVRHARARGDQPASREAFYVETLRRRYSTINRCC